MPTQPAVTWTVDEAIEVIKTTAPLFLEGAVDAIKRDRLELSMLEKRGCIHYGKNSPSQTWNTDYDEPPIQVYGSGTEFTFHSYDYWKQNTLDQRGYIATARVHYADVKMNGGPQAIVNLMDAQMPKLEASMRHSMHSELYTDGMASGNDRKWCGYETFLADDGATVDADIIARPSDNYAGQLTNPGDASSNWSSSLSTFPNAIIAKDWPEGKGSSAFDWNSPVLPNWSSSTGWGTGSGEWIDNCEVLITATWRWLRKNAGIEAEPDALILPSHMHREYSTYMKARYRIEVSEHEEAHDLGFGNVYKQDGMMIYCAFDCPVNTGYFLNFDKMELNCVLDQLWETEDAWLDKKTDNFLFKVRHLGNLRFVPKYFGKTKNYA